MKLTADTFRGHVMDDAWWKNATYLVELLAIPFKVMRATDSSAKGMMGTIYDVMLQLTEDVNDKLEAGEKILPRAVADDIGNIVRRRWDESLACAFHVVGRILNPANQEEGIFRNDMECTRIFKAFIAHHYDGKTFTNKDGEERRASLSLAVLPGNTPEPALPKGYNKEEEGEEKEGEEDDAVLTDEYVE
ncbi:unnamed protein product [Closterium sp. NIES-64]|nr:unnamed protein product [Closterium sp. NIES-64]